MSECEICGTKNAKFKIKLEGVIVNVCKNCTDLGEPVTKPRIEKRTFAAMPSELNYILCEDFGKRIKRKREALGLTQEKLAKKLMLKVSIITRIEGGWEPPLPIVEKLEKFFKTSFRQELKEIKTSKAQRRAVTIGDIAEVKIEKKKR